MPSRGYRKGVNDTEEPLPRQVYTRTSEHDHLALTREAASRAITVSDLVRALVRSHLTDGRVELPHPRGASCEALRELARIGNNLNQLTRQANTGLVTVAAGELRRCLDEVNAAAQRLRA